MDVHHDGLMFVVLVGEIDDPGWHGVPLSAYDAIVTARGRCGFSEKNLHHRRGDFSCLSVGISYGGGQKVGLNFYHITAKSLKSISGARQPLS